MVSTHLKNISQIGKLPQIRGENKKSLQPPPSYRYTSRVAFFLGIADRHFRLAQVDGFLPENLAKRRPNPGYLTFHWNTGLFKVPGSKHFTDFQRFWGHFFQDVAGFHQVKILEARQFQLNQPNPQCFRLETVDASENYREIKPTCWMVFENPWYITE